jgi:hypothetical protein
MKAGDLRRFNPKSFNPALPNIGGKRFMVIAVEPAPGRTAVSLLLDDGKLMERLNILWVEQNSGAIHESR